MSVQQIQLTNIHPMPQPRQYICNSCILPEGNRNYCLVDKMKWIILLVKKKNLFLI